MSTPVSTKLAPSMIIDPKIRRRYYHIYLIQIWLSLLPAAFMAYWFYYPGEESFLLPSLWPNVALWFYFITAPFYATLIYIVTVVWSALITKLRLYLLDLRCEPREGVFRRDKSDRNYLYWNKRNMTRLFLFWLLHSTPFTFMKDYFSYKFFGVPVGKDAVLNHAWLSPEFIEIGDDVKIGQGACVYSYMFEQDKLLVAKVTIEDDVLIGPQCVLFPGTVVREGSTIDGGSFTHPFTELESHAVYHGTPVKKVLVDKKK